MSDDPFPVVCLPFAGSGAGFYRSLPAATAARHGLSVLPIQLPGREELFLDEPFTDVAAAVAQLAPQVIDRTARLPRFALFGHSLGAVLSYEIARELQRRGERRLAHLFVSGSPGPWTGRDARASGLADEEFIERVQEFAGYRHAAFDNPDLRELLLPVLRADVAMHEDYQPSSDEPLDVAVTSLRGATDDLVTAWHAQQWRSVTRGGFDYTELPGGHMYLVDSPAVLLRAIAAGLALPAGR